jgi:hypothetical protein
MTNSTVIFDLCILILSALNFYDWFYTAVFLHLILVKWTLGYAKHKESKYSSVAVAASIYA